MSRNYQLQVKHSNELDNVVQITVEIPANMNKDIVISNVKKVIDLYEKFKEEELAK